MNVFFLMAIHPVAVEIFQSEPKWSADRLADCAISRATALEIRGEVITRNYALKEKVVCHL